MNTCIPLSSCAVPLSIYLHIPFCTSKCDYCDFFSQSGIAEPLMVRILEEEVRALDSSLSILTPPLIDTLYIGGGTPSVVPPTILRSFLERIFTSLPNIPAENTIEANPESFSLEFLQVIRDFPINRLSLGIQTFQPSFFPLLHRNSSPEINRKALDLVQEQWDRKLSIDLLYGIPGSTVKEALIDLEVAIRYHPHHISLYYLTPEENTRYGERIRKGELKLLSSFQEEKIRKTLLGRAKEFGYRQYEISNLAFPGEECKHNLRYWELRPYLGIGPSAVSTLPGIGNRILRITETSDLEQYGGQRDEQIQRNWEEIPPKVFLKEVFLMGLRTVFGIQRDSFLRMFGEIVEEVIPQTIQKYKRYFTMEKTRLTLTNEGRWWLNRILIDLFDEIDRFPNRIRCVWPV
ncbi:MAG: coproporphyrinogen III oxidase family protein [Spirochaetes bacterium]|nr:coproporphyrinogen III oxidase family protein [Spirochaetota bacterium]